MIRTKQYNAPIIFNPCSPPKGSFNAIFFRLHRLINRRYGLMDRTKYTAKSGKV